MNYREFTERVYNYKHGLTKSAESQNIEHSAKQTEETNEEKKEESTEESIQHSAPGDEWEQHEYIKKIPIGNGKFRYVYEEGQNAGKSIVNYGAPKTSAPKSNLPLAPAPAAQQQAQTPAPKAPAVTNSGKSNAQSPSSPSFVDGRNAAYGNEQKKEATTEEKQTGISNNEVALELLTKYANGLKGVYDTLKSKGYDENEVDEIINTIEGAFGYSNIYNQVKNYNGEQIQFFDGAEEGLKNMIEEVLPEAKNYAETIPTKQEIQAREDMWNFMAPLRVKEVEMLDTAQKIAQNGGLPAKEETPAQQTTVPANDESFRGALGLAHGLLHDYLRETYPEDYDEKGIEKVTRRDYDTLYASDPTYKELVDRIMKIEPDVPKGEGYYPELIRRIKESEPTNQAPSNTIEGTINSDGTLNFPSSSKESNAPASSTFNPSYDWGDKVNFEQVQNDVIADSKIPGITLQDLKNKYNRWSEEYIRELVYNTTGKTLK